MSGNKSIEARLHRSLVSQIAVPKLDGRFDAAVWARIEAEDAKSRVAAAESAPARGARLMFVCNAIGVTVVLALVAGFLVQQFGGHAVDAARNLPVSLPADVAVPHLTDDMTNQIIGIAGYVLSAVVIAFGISLTSFGQRIRANFG
jgi:hypothetical protein